MTTWLHGHIKDNWMVCICKYPIDQCKLLCNYKGNVCDTVYLKRVAYEIGIHECLCLIVFLIFIFFLFLMLWQCKGMKGRISNLLFA